MVTRILWSGAKTLCTAGDILTDIARTTDEHPRDKPRVA